MADRGLGRRRPPDFEHVELYPFSAVAPQVSAVVERCLALPSWHWTHDQGKEGSCVGHGSVMERSITNIAQNRTEGVRPFARRYNPLHIWNEAKKIDPWPDTNPGDDNGTSVSAAYDVLRNIGPIRVRSMGLRDNVPYPYPATGAPAPVEGVAANRWARTVDEARTAIALGMPVTIGVDWYSGFDAAHLKQVGSEWFTPDPSEDMGKIRGGHCVCIYGASDHRQAFKFKNSWGKGYPLVWMPYETLDKLLRDGGEVCLVTDR